MTEVRPYFQANPGANGVSEILALNAQELLVLERGFAADNATDKTTSQIRIYHADLRGTPDARAAYAASEAPPSSVIRKTLLIDLANVVKQFTPPFQSLDNFEAMCFGPVLPDGSRSVVLAVDDNYSERQRTAFVLLRLRKQ